MGLFKTLGKLAKGTIKTVGKVAPFAAPFIPGLGPLAAGGIGALGSLAAGKGIKGAVLGGLGSGLGSAVLGGRGGLSALGKLGGIAKGVAKVGGKVGGNILSTLGKTFKTPEGGLDLGKILGLGGAATSFIGGRQASGRAREFNEANARFRQQLMERILERPNFDFTR